MPSGGAASGSMGTSGALDTSTLIETEDATAMASGLNVNAHDLASYAVYGSDGNKIGEVNKVLADRAMAVKAITVEAGGFLGIGSREVVIPIDKLSKGTQANQLNTTLTKDEVQNLQTWTAKKTSP
jgi:hypothetical protein